MLQATICSRHLSEMYSVNVQSKSIPFTKLVHCLLFVGVVRKNDHIGRCLKYLNSRYCSLVKIQCMEILSILMDAKNKDISIFMGDCLVFSSKFNRTSDVQLIVEGNTQTEEKIAYLHFLGSILRNFLLASDSSIFVNTIPTVYKQLQKLMRTETVSEVVCLVPELYYQICVISMEFPISGITVPLMVNEVFSLFKQENNELQSFSCRYGAMLFSELVTRSMDHKYFRNRDYQITKGQDQSENPSNKKKEEVYIYNPSDYTFESVIRIFITKMNGGSEDDVD